MTKLAPTLQAFFTTNLTTFIVYTSEMVSFYSDLFKIMWTDSKQTFHELTELQM